MVTSAELDRLQRLNFVLQTLQERVTPDAIARELGRDDPQDAALVSQRLRTTAGRDAALASMIALYKDVIEAHRQDGAYDARLDLQAGRCPLSPGTCLHSIRGAALSVSHLCPATTDPSLQSLAPRSQGIDAATRR
jgi:hypothetical protein